MGHMRPHDLPCRPSRHPSSLLCFFAARAVAGVEEVDGSTYRRSVRLPHGPGVIALDLTSRSPGWRRERGDPRDAAAAAAVCGALLDTEADPEATDGALAADPLLRPLVDGAPGRRVPGC